MKSLASAAILSTLLSTTAAAVQINELRIDQPSNDDDEYLELFGAPGEALDGLSYVILGDGTAGSGEIEYALDLTGHSIGASGFFLVAEDADTLGTAADLEVTLNFENSDNVTHLLLSGFSGATSDDLDVDDDGVLEATPWTGIEDGLALVEDLAVPPSGTEHHYGGQLGLPVIGPDGSSTPSHVYRLPDGGPFQIGPFDPVTGLDTPGRSNIPEPATGMLLALATAAAVLLVRRSPKPSSAGR